MFASPSRSRSIMLLRVARLLALVLLPASTLFAANHSVSAVPKPTPVSGRINQPPTRPAGVVAVADDGKITLSWAANSDDDLRGYNVYRSTTLPVDTSGTPLNGATPLTINAELDAGLHNGTSYYYVVEAVDDAGLRTQSAPVSATPLDDSAVVDVKINFQDQDSLPPSGYFRDYGEAFDARVGVNQGSGLSYGWVEPGTNIPRSLVGNGRKRTAPDLDPRLATFLHMQANDVTSSNFTGVKLPGAWELALPNGSYNVTVSVGDSNQIDSIHHINVEGQTAINGFVPTTANTFAAGSVTVNVIDGRLTIDANSGKNTKINYVTIRTAPTGARPSVTGTTPVSGATNVSRDAAVVATVNLPTSGAGVDSTTLTAATVKLVRTNDGVQVPGNANTSGGGDVIVLQPSVLLDANTSYTFQVTEGVKDTSGAAFIAYTSTFRTGTAGGTTGGTIKFNKETQPKSEGKAYGSLVMGPDGKLYASTLDGEIVRFPIGTDGSLGTPQTITTLQTYTGSTIKRAIVGMVFDPAATASNPILWVSHSYWPFLKAPDWTGKITRLSGATLQTAEDYVINLPRSYKDHMNNSLAFGPDGKLYLPQGSNTAMGQPDNAWGNREERLLAGAILQIDLSKIASMPLDVKTEAGGTYNPYAPDAPLTIYATGVRNAYDLVWHSNGQLYAPANGSAAGGNTPATPAALPAACQNRIDKAERGAYTGPSVPALTSTGTTAAQKTPTETDYLFRVTQGGYYGHPNPLRCEWVLNGGNPTEGVDPAEIVPDTTGGVAYPVGVQPDRNYRGYAYDFGNNKSPNGAIEYKSNAFGGALKGNLLVVRYSSGNDIIALTPGANGDIARAETGIQGFTNFVDPIDLVENPVDGSIYVAELIGYEPGKEAGRITLLRPSSVSGTPNIAVNATRLVSNAVAGGSGATQTLTIQNTGDSALSISTLDLVADPAAGNDQTDQFQITNKPALPKTVGANGTLNLTVTFDPTSIGVKSAILRITSNDPDTGQVDVLLRGLGTKGTGGSNEPSLQWILDTYQIPVNVGDNDPATGDLLPQAPLVGDEISLPRFQKAASGPVTVEPLAVFGPSAANPVLRFGWYNAGSAANLNEVFTVGNSPASNAQTLNVPISGAASFDPGAGAFGFYVTWPQLEHTSFSEDALNTWDSGKHKVRVFPYRTATGAAVPNAYVVAVEDRFGPDNQDLVFVVRNLRPEAQGPPPTETPTTGPTTTPTPLPANLRKGWMPIIEK